MGVDLITIFKSLEGNDRMEMGTGLGAMVSSFMLGKLRLDEEELPDSEGEEGIKHCYRLARAVVKSLFLEILKRTLDKHLVEMA